MSCPSHQNERKPSWLKVKLPNNREFWATKDLVQGKKLYTVCEEAHCPNRYECWSHGTATFMIGGDRCTRACGFCAVKTAKPFPLDEGEPLRVAEAVAYMKLRHAVVTTVTRDDLKDGGAGHFAETIKSIRRLSPSTIIEVLTSDFNGKFDSLHACMDARPHIFNHNLETVERLSPLVRFRAQYHRSLDILQEALRYVDGKVATKSGIMLGLGETEDEILKTMDDLRDHGVTVLTMGQYLRPSKNHLPVISYIHPDQFAKLKEIAHEKGFTHVASGPLVRSSYHAANFAPEENVLDAINADLARMAEEVS